MASLDKELPPPPKTPSFYNRLKAMSTRTWSRSESRASMSRDQYSARPPSTAPSRQGSISRSHDTRADRSQSRASAAKPDRFHHIPQGLSSTRQPSSSSALHTQQHQQQYIQTSNHIVYQAKPQSSYDTYQHQPGSPERAQTTQPDVGYAHPYSNSPVMPYDYYQQFPRPQMSQNVLRRRPSIIGNYSTEKQPTGDEGRPSLSLDTSLALHEVRANKPPNEAVSMSRRTPDDLKSSIRQPARSLKTPDNLRANSRATSRAATYTSASPSSPSTTRHDTPSVFSHASRATSRTAYSPSSINAMEPQTWTTDPDAPPVPEIKSKVPRTTTHKPPFVPPELAHLAYTPHIRTQVVSSRNQYPRLTSTDEHYPHAGPLGFAVHSNTMSGRVASSQSPSHDLQLANATSSSSPSPLKSMDPTLRARVTLNTTTQPPTSEITGNKPSSKSKSTTASNRQATSRVKVVDVPPRSSLTSATTTPRISLDKNKPSTSYSSARPSMTQYRSPRLSIQCQGNEESPATQPTRDNAKQERSQRASHSRAFSFSKTPLRTKSSMESLRSKFSFAQRMFNKSVDQLSCVGPVDMQQQQQQQQPSLASGPVSIDKVKSSTRQTLEAQPRTESIRLRTRQALNELNPLSSSSRTSIDVPRHVTSKSKPPSSGALPSVIYTGRSSTLEQSPPSQAAQLYTQRMSHNSNSTVRIKAARNVSGVTNVKNAVSNSSTSKQSRDSNSSTGHDTASPAEGQEFIRFSAMTSVRESSSSDRSSVRTSSQARLSRLNSADSGRSTNLASYGLFPQTKTTPPKSKPVPARSSEHQVKDVSTPELVKPPATTKTVQDQHVDINLRLGGLSASTAISSKALFSPGGAQVQSSVGEKILVMDGNGEDWSLYCASLVPNADVFNASLTSPTYTNRDELTKLRGLMNHKEVPAFDLSTQFPLPSNHFSVVAFRFPPIMEESLLRHMICEIKRILRPGGYVEIMAIDLDLAKMGSDTRRALRDHKTRLSTSNINVCLKDPTDNLPRLLSHRHFENLRWGVFSVPAAGQSIQPIDKLWLTKQDSDFAEEATTASYRPAEVAQWWYKQSYESPDATMSIWQDQVVVRECARLQTCFKVLVCYAQKPAMVRRRTASV